jgi:hypothetical protein
VWDGTRVELDLAKVRKFKRFIADTSIGKQPLERMRERKAQDLAASRGGQLEDDICGASKSKFHYNRFFGFW